MTNRLEHAPNLTVTTFRQGNLVPAIGTLSTARLERRELGQSIVQRDTFEQALFFFVAQSTQHTDRIFAFKAKAGVHQTISQLA